MKLEITYKPIDKIVGYVNNTRIHPQSQIEQIKASIKEFGMCNPIGIHNDTILFGHGRWEALKQLDYKEVPTIDLSHLSEAQKKALIIADNKIGENAEWDEDLLQIELLEIDEMGFDYSDIMEFDFDVEDFDEEFSPDLPSGDREPIRNMTFTVSDEQHEIIEECLKLAKDFPLQDPAGINENSNGNALYYICEVFKNNVS
ncbi:MAG: ParB/Srx family N-terminal domain-containing protein [Campylobacterota bacterium]|nr:ParB/Srx family N-terminal domain-containing protein [Campylobacterota bacterium]